MKNWKKELLGQQSPLGPQRLSDILRAHKALPGVFVHNFKMVGRHVYDFKKLKWDVEKIVSHFELHPSHRELKIVKVMDSADRLIH